jgi:uncharacterized protein YajQ (UPF0234 family)
MPSFDIVSRTDLAEIDNALNNLRREITTRFDFKDSKSTIERKDAELTINADDDMKLRQLHEMLKGHLTRRKVDASVLDFKEPEKAAGASLRQSEQDLARKVVKAIKDKKIKVQVAIQGDELRVSGKKRDDLQAAIETAKGLDLGLPLQYINFRD